MALKFKYASKDQIPPEHAALYAERDGAWCLDAEGVVEKSKLDEFRATNVTLLKERDDLKQRFEGIDPEEVRKLAEDKRKLEEAQQVKAGEVDKVIETRVKSARAEWDKQHWGDLDPEDAAENELSITEGFRLLSAYTDRHGVKFWIITEWDRSVTTVVLPGEN